MGIKDYISSEVALERDAVFCGIGARMRAYLRKAACEILASDSLLGKLEAVDAAIVSHDWKLWDESPRREFPNTSSLGAQLFHAFPVLHHVEGVRRFYAERGIPESYARALMKDLPRWIETYADRKGGRIGFGEVGWLRMHLSGKLFQIGRLQFEPTSWYFPFTMLENRTKKGEFVLVAHADGRVARCGQFVGSKGVDDSGAVDLVYEERADGFYGHRVDADGNMALEPELFPAADWEVFLKDGDPVYNIHIPSGSPLDPGKCRWSVRHAVSFMKKYFPDHPVSSAKVMMCESWLLYPRFQKILPATSNIVGFQKMFHFFPMPDSNDWQFYERVFVPDGRAVTRDKLRTGLQVALFNDIEKGHIPLGGGGVIPLSADE